MIILHPVHILMRLLQGRDLMIRSTMREHTGLIIPSWYRRRPTGVLESIRIGLPSCAFSLKDRRVSWGWVRGARSTVPTRGNLRVFLDSLGAELWQLLRLWWGRVEDHRRWEGVLGAWSKVERKHIFCVWAWLLLDVRFRKRVWVPVDDHLCLNL